MMISKIRGEAAYRRHFHPDGRPKIIEWNPDVQEPARSALLAICHICGKPRADWLCQGDLGGGIECGRVICDSHASWRMANGHAVPRCPYCIGLHDEDHRRLIQDKKASRCPICGILKSSLF